MSTKIRNRHRLKKKEIKFFVNQLKNKFDSDFFDADSLVETGYIDEFKVILVDDEIDFMIIERSIVFTLHGLYKHNPKRGFVVVDMGAVSYVTKGADIMAPGITDADINIQKNDYIWVCDEKHRKPLAIGIALMTGEEMKNKNSGKAVKNIHYVGDKLWNLSRQTT
jgi:PUA domain protein